MRTTPGATGRGRRRGRSRTAGCATRQTGTSPSIRTRHSAIFTYTRERSRFIRWESGVEELDLLESAHESEHESGPSSIIQCIHVELGCEPLVCSGVLIHYIPGPSSRHQPELSGPSFPGPSRLPLSASPIRTKPTSDVCGTNMQEKIRRPKKPQSRRLWADCM